MPDFIKEDAHDYENNNDNDLNFWRGCSMVALEKKTEDFDNALKFPQRKVQTFKIPLYAANQAIDDAHADVRNGVMLRIDDIIKDSIKQYGIKDGYESSYANVYRRTRRQLARK